MDIVTVKLVFSTAENISILSRLRQSAAVAFNSLSDYAVLLFAFGCVPALLILFYNGKRGPNLKWAFYAFYPIHQLVYAALWLFMLQPMI
jgi:hypothetical protein